MHCVEGTRRDLFFKLVFQEEGNWMGTMEYQSEGRLVICQNVIFFHAQVAFISSPFQSEL